MNIRPIVSKSMTWTDDPDVSTRIMSIQPEGSYQAWRTHRGWCLRLVRGCHHLTLRYRTKFEAWAAAERLHNEAEAARAAGTEFKAESR